MRSYPLKRRLAKGFTLVEAAIVLVVIGLILGVVLQGQSMIRNAEYRSFKSDITDYQSAFYGFSDRYNNLPGDMPEAEVQSRIREDLDGPTGSNAGNGVINDGAECSDPGDESCMAWQHLRGAGQIRGNPLTDGNDAQPQHPYGGVFNAFFTGTDGNGRFENKLLITDVPGNIAERLDAEVDDEEPDRGRISCTSGCDADGYPGADTRADIAVSL